MENWNASHSSVNKPKSPLSFGHGLRGRPYKTSSPYNIPMSFMDSPLGAFHILRQHIFVLFHLVCQH